jgi:hypothetical protein
MEWIALIWVRIGTIGGLVNTVDIYVGFASASSNLAAPSYNSPQSTRECTDLLRTFHAFCHYTPVLPNILLAEEVGQYLLSSSR